MSVAHRDVNEWNDKTAEISGFSKEEAFDEDFVDMFVVPESRKPVASILEAAFKGRGTSNFGFDINTKSRGVRHLLVNATTRRDAEGNVIGMIGVAQDITESVQQTAEIRRMHCLQAKQEAKVETERNMTAYFAHELRNPLGAIDNALDSMPENLPVTANSLVEGMKLCCNFMASIMGNLLDVRKMDEGKMKLRRDPMSLAEVVAKVHKMLLPSVKPGVSFKISHSNDANAWAIGDEHRIQQVFTNVVTNAIKYTVSGSITLCIGWKGSEVVFECNDTGPGIPKGEQDRLFHRFVMRGGAPGTGLGLAIAKHIVLAHGGRIWAESKLGKGSSFFFSIRN